MSYEGQMLENLRMPSRADVEVNILKALLRHRGVLKEFASGVDIVDEIADEFALTEQQRTATLERIYRKENRTVHSLLWHRLLFRAADSLAKSGLVSRPTATLQLSGRREWMLTEKGFDDALRLEGKEELRKEELGVRSFEVQKEVKNIISAPRPRNYDPVEPNKRLIKRSSSSYFRGRGFRQAVIEAYDCRCAFCGLKLISPDSLRWEVQASHIVPNNMRGKDDVWNGLALCGIHHWAFDVGWLSLNDKFVVETSTRTKELALEFGRIGKLDLLRMFEKRVVRINLPSDSNLFPHENAILWHRRHRFVS
jgi:hypothetical protein